MYDDESVLIKYNSLLFSAEQKRIQGNIYFFFDVLKYLYLMHFIGNQDVDYCGRLSQVAR